VPNKSCNYSTVSRKPKIHSFSLLQCVAGQTFPQNFNNFGTSMYRVKQSSTNLFLIKPTRPTNLPRFYFVKKNSTCFGHFLCPSSGTFYCNSTLVYFLQVWWQLPSTGSILTLLGSCHQTCKKYTNVECTVENS
jgi:hypothetical protein